MPSSLPPAPEFGAPVPQAASAETLERLALRRSVSAAMLTAPGPDDDQIADLLRIGARAPDHGKLNPWRFVVIRGEAKAALVQRLQALARVRGEGEGALMKLAVPPLAIAVVSCRVPGKIPEWEQVLSAGAVCTLLLVSAGAMGFGANWITDWYGYDREALALIGVGEGESLAGFVYIGTSGEAPQERVRPDVAALVTDLISVDFQIKLGKLTT